MTTPDPLAVACPACLAPAGVSCGEQPHTDRIRLADLRALEEGTCALCGRVMVRGSVEGSPIDAWHPYERDAAVCPPIPDPATNWEAYSLAVNLGAEPGHPGIEHFRPLDTTAPPLGTALAAALDFQDALTQAQDAISNGAPVSVEDLQRLAQNLHGPAPVEVVAAISDATGLSEAAVAGALTQALNDPITEPLQTGWPPSRVICPECAAGKCPNCTSDTLHPVTDQMVPCECSHA